MILERLSFKKILVYLSIIGVIGFSLRLNFFLFEVPLTFDSLEYFFYAMDISVIGSLPQNYTPINNGWPIFLSVFFSLFSFEDSISFMELQRIISVVISTLTIIPIYYLCNKFVTSTYSIVGAGIFAFEPRIIQNSLLGIADPLYIFLTATSIWMIFSSKQKFIYFSFALASLSTIVRSEGLFLFLAISIIFILKNRRTRVVIPKYILAVIIFLLIIAPISLYRIDVQGTDGIFYRVSSSINASLDPPKYIDPNWITPPRSIQDSIFTSFENFPKYLIWDLIPIFIFFIPIGIIFLFREINWKKAGIIISIISMSLPALFAYSLPLNDTRYFYFLYPLFCVVSVIGLPKILKRFKKENVLILLLIGILISSSIFMQFKMWDKEHELEAYKIAKFIVENTQGVNQFPEDLYIQSAQIPKSTVDLQSYFNIEREKMISVKESTLNKIQVIPTKGHNSLDKFIDFGEKNGLTHVVISENKVNYLNISVFDEKNYPFLIKEFDSRDKNFKNYVKIYKIDFEKFYQFKN